MLLYEEYVFCFSFENCIENCFTAYEGMKNLCYGLGMDQPEGILRAASAFYRVSIV